MHAGGARLPKFHTSVGGGGDLQDEQWYPKHGELVPLRQPFLGFGLAWHCEALSSLLLHKDSR